MPAATKNLIALAIIIFVSPTEISAFSKYGRSCQDIGCRSDEKCTMMETSCTLSTGGQCGPYPSCIKDDTAGKKNCRSMNCPTGQYCKTENGRAVCKMASTNLGYDSADVSPMNGQETNPQDHRSHDSNSNPYANANAPPAEDVFGPPAKPFHPVDSSSNSGFLYPAYPNYPGSGNSYPSGNNNGNNQPGRNDGYPPYPNNNRMPIPGQSGYPYGYGQNGQYPMYSPPGYPQQPTNGQRYPAQYSGYQNNYPSQSSSGNRNFGFRRNAGSHLVTSSMTLIMTASLALYTFFRAKSES